MASAETVPKSAGVMRGGWRPAGQCAVCRNWTVQPFCAACIGRFTATVPRCPGCALRLPLDTQRCGACLRDPPPFGHCVCAFDYVFPWNRLIAEFKFNQRVELARPLAARLLHALAADRTPLPGLLVPVPLGPKRLAERGYNQAWQLARQLGRSVHRPACADLLERPIDTEHQADLPLQRRVRNMRGAFMLNRARRERLRGQHVALVDDVMTSGATLREAAACLLRGGAARVDVWVLARTPPPGH
jgi:ComF family protein